MNYHLCPSQVTGDVLVYSGDLRFVPTDQSQVPHAGRHVVCTYPRWVSGLRPPERVRQNLVSNVLGVFCCPGPKTGPLGFTTRCLTRSGRPISSSIWKLPMVGKDAFHLFIYQLQSR